MVVKVKSSSPRRAAQKAAEYVRMSTEHQQYSTHNQGKTIREYADRHGYEVVRTYADEGKSGLRLEGRAGLKQLLADVELDSVPFDTILVYDISRWGRFQDADESAYYEYICRRAGLKVVYCAEQFDNDGSPTATIIKSVKRAMAGEYSRELSVKVFAGQCRLVELGFRQGGEPGYGLRRLLLDQNGTVKGELSPGERKSIQTDRVVLVPGPAAEVDGVRLMYHLCSEGMRMVDIARKMNARGTLSGRGRPWQGASIRAILSNEKYVGTNLYNRTSFKLKRTHTVNPPEMWVRKDHAFEGVVSRDLFDRVQLALSSARKRLSDEEILAQLAAIHKQFGRLSGRLVNEHCEVKAWVVHARFGGIGHVCARLGLPSGRDLRYLQINQRVREMFPVLLAEAEQWLQKDGASCVTSSAERMVHVNGELSISLIITRCKTGASGNSRWKFCIGDDSRAHMTIAVRLDERNEKALDFFVFPRCALPGQRISCAQFNHANIESFRFDALEELSQIGSRAPLGWAV